MAKRQPTAIVIEDPAGKGYGGVRGRIERLYREFLTKAQALRLTADILEDDDRRNAVAAAPKKFLAAMNHRDGAAGRTVLKPRAPKKAKSPIHGKQMSLFLLEHLTDKVATPITVLVDALAAAGSPVGSSQALNGPLGAALVRRGFVKKTAEGYRRTAKGAARATDLRQTLEAKGKIPPGGYGGEMRS